MRKRGFIGNIDTAQNRLIIAGFIVTTLIIVGVALFSMTQIRDRLYAGYSSFGQLLTKTLAIQTYELTRDLPQEYKTRMIRHQVEKILEANEDISYITFKDAENSVLYSSESEFPSRSKKTKNNRMESPIRDLEGKIIGYVEVGLSADMAGMITKTTRNSMLAVFTLVWLVFMLVIIANAFFIARELTLLQRGVREISSGNFGTTLDTTQTSGETRELFAAFNDMSQRLHAYEEQNVDTLTLEKNKLESVLMSIANGVVVCDNSDKITIINNAAQEILSAQAEGILGTKIQEYYDTNGDLCFRDKITLFKNTPLDIMEKKPLEFNVHIATRVVKSIISPIYSKMHDYLGYIIILIDVTKEAEVDKLKNDFISNVSHELRTPVTVLRSYADTLYNYGENFSYEEQREFIGTINQEVMRLNRMVNDILDFSKLQSTETLEKVTQDISKTIEETLGALKILADEKGITFSVMKEPELPAVTYNEASIARTLSNLITNAIKYSNDNSRVKIRTELAKNPDFIEVSIEDFGIGIAEEHLDRIYDRFYRVENDTHTIKGTGLGLHLVKIAIEKHHNGEVFVRSRLGEGSTFGFRLPIDYTKIVIPQPEIKVEARLEEKIPEQPSRREIVEEFIDTQNEARGEARYEADDWEISFEVRDKADKA